MTLGLEKTKDFIFLLFINIIINYTKKNTMHYSLYSYKLTLAGLITLSPIL